MSTTNSPRQNVLILGATGATGRSIVDGLLGTGRYHVIAGIRPSSLNKPEAAQLRERSVEIRPVDLDADDTSKLVAAFQGVDTLLCCLVYSQIDTQYKIADAAKSAGVKRFVPNDWGTACVRGKRKLYDQKAKVQDYVKSIGLGHTFIDVGYWMALFVPIEPERSEFPQFRLQPSNSYETFGTGDVKTATIDRQDIRKFVAEIIGDERTLNRYVFCWGEEVSQNEIWDVARKVKVDLGKELTISPQKALSEDEMVKIITGGDPESILSFEYFYSMFIRGDNVVENAKKPEYGGALDARELYPHLKITTLEEYIKRVYSK